MELDGVVTLAGDTSQSFFVVGVGVSTAHVAPSTELLRHLGAEPGIALVIVHSSPATHPAEDQLTKTLAAVSAMPVHEASDQPVEVNHVYVMPPAAELALHDRRLQRIPRSDGGDDFLPIDRFFESLAQDQSSLAIGVVLSGPGADGALGIRSIQANGGITLAQDSTAEYPSMPSSAIATGCVDFVLPPDKIAVRLRALANLSGSHIRAVDGRAVERIAAVVRATAGIDFAEYAPSTLRRRLERRMRLRGKESAGDYAALLERDPDEATALSEDGRAYVTRFFRDEDRFEALKTTVFPSLLEHHRDGSPIRVWVPGCSSGEEVYSLAISLVEFLQETGRCKVFGTDLSAKAIAAARLGRYPIGIQRDVSPGRLAAFFSRRDDYQIAAQIRRLCVFARHDLTCDPPIPVVDLLSAPDLSDYKDEFVEHRLVPLFHHALRSGGFLLMGSGGRSRPLPGFTIADAKHGIYALGPVPFKNGSAPGPAWSGRRKRDAGLAATTESAMIRHEADRVVVEAFGPPGVVVDDDLTVVHFRGQTSPYLELPQGVPTYDLLRMARGDLRAPLQRAIDEVRSSHTTSRVTVDDRPGSRQIEIQVIPFEVAPVGRSFLLVLFSGHTEPDALPSGAARRADVSDSIAESQVRRELGDTDGHFQSLIEQLEATNEELIVANEEIASSNAELRSQSNELQLTNEALLAANEELRAANEGAARRNLEVTHLNADLTNVLSSVGIPIILLDGQLCVRRFTPAAARVLHLDAADVGAPLERRGADLAKTLSQMAVEAMEQLRPLEKSVEHAGRWYLLAARPYLTAERRIEGAVVSVLDVDEMKKEAQREAREYAELVVDTVRECLVVLDGDLRVRSGNRAFYRTFRLDHEQVQGRAFRELGHGEWNLPVLLERLESLVEGDSFEGFRVDHEIPKLGPRTFVLKARRIENTALMLVVMEDVTESERALKLARQAEIEFRNVLTQAAEPILLTNSAGFIAFANRAAAALFRYETEEMTGLAVEELVPASSREQHARERQAYLSAPEARAMGRDRALLARRKDGSEFAVEVALSPVEQESGHIVVCFITDVTSRREAEARIRTYQERLRQVAFDTAVAEERERRRIAVGLHDQIGQSLALAGMKLESLRKNVDGDGRKVVNDTKELIQQSIEDVRTLTFDLSPPILYDLGLKEALVWLADDLEKRFGLKVDVRTEDMPLPLDDTTSALLFRAVRELLTNVLKHANAPSASVSLRRSGDAVHIAVEDAGVGFDVDQLTSGPSNQGFGLFSVREQIGRLGGKLDIDSTLRQGTTVRLQVPLAGAISLERPS